MGLFARRRNITSSPRGPRGGKFDADLTHEIKRIVEAYLQTGNGGIYEGSGELSGDTVVTMGSNSLGFDGDTGGIAAGATLFGGGAPDSWGFNRQDPLDPIDGIGATIMASDFTALVGTEWGLLVNISDGLDAEPSGGMLVVCDTATKDSLVRIDAGSPDAGASLVNIYAENYAGSTGDATTTIQAITPATGGDATITINAESANAGAATSVGLVATNGVQDGYFIVTPTNIAIQNEAAAGYTIPLADGNAGEGLVSDGAGALSFGQEGIIHEIISFDYTEVNAYPAVPSYSKNGNALPSGTYAVEYLIKIDGVFTSATRVIDSIRISIDSREQIIFNLIGSLTTGDFYASAHEPATTVAPYIEDGAALASSIFCEFVGGGANPQDFTAGAITLYARVKQFPTLT